MGAATDTLGTADALEGAGLDADTAKATARAIETGCASAVEGLVTRDGLRAELKALETRLVLWGAGIVLGGTALVLSGVGVLLRLVA